MPDSDNSDAVAGGQVDEPTVEPTVRKLLLARIDEHCRLLGLELHQVAKACEQLAPERVVPERHHHGVRDGRRDPPAGPRPPTRQPRPIAQPTGCRPSPSPGGGRFVSEPAVGIGRRSPGVWDA
jgi:hypothetical protein